MTQNDNVEEELESIASASLLAIVSRSLESALGAVSLPQFRLLVILARSRWTPIAHLAPLAGASSQAVEEMIHSMENDGWISVAGADTASDPAVGVTVHGRQLVKHVTTRRRAEIVAVLERMSEPDRRKVADAFGRFASAAGEPGTDELQLIDTSS